MTQSILRREYSGDGVELAIIDRLSAAYTYVLSPLRGGVPGSSIGPVTLENNLREIFHPDFSAAELSQRRGEIS